VTEFLPGLNPPRKASRIPSLGWVVFAAAASIALLAALLWPRQPEARSFATLESSSAARWESSDLPTKDGTRLGKGTLHLTEGLVMLRFDSGAQVSLEAPVSVTLVDSMNCILSSGIAVADVPESALGFRISTPSANVIDYGTRFSVNVDSAAGRTQTHVLEGLVEVEHLVTGGVVALKAGQMNSADKTSVSEARDWNLDSS
jgi:ferric-dicitrate binding protein FerR (iron transport regulator)